MAVNVVSQGMSYRDELLHFVIVIVFLVLATNVVILRFWARHIQKVKWGLNDYLMIIGLAAAIALSIYDVITCCGFFTPKPHSPEAYHAVAVQGLKSAFISPILWVFAVTVIRASILTLFIDVFCTPVFRTTCWVVFAANLAFFFGTVLAMCLICRPTSFRWEQINGAQGTCGDQKPLDLFIAAFNLLLDVVVVVLPMPVLSRLNMKTGKKAGLVGIFGMGIVICAVTAYRVYISSTINPTNMATTYSVIALLTTLEALLGIINACLPLLRPVLKKLLGNNSLTSIFRRSRSGEKSSGTRSTKRSIPRTLRIANLLQSQGTYTGTTQRSKTSQNETLASSAAEQTWRVERTEKEKRELWRESDEQSESETARIMDNAGRPSKQERVLGQKMAGVNIKQKMWDEES